MSSYLIIALVAFSTLRFAGYPVELGTVIWPGNWHNFGRAKAQFFFNKGKEALEHGDYREGTMALNLAYQLDPSHYTTGLLLARFSTLLQADKSDLLFRDLMQRHPENAKVTAEHWLRSTLARGNLTEMRNLALLRLAAGDMPNSPWIHALLFSTKLLKDDATLRDFVSRPEGAEWKHLIETELLIRSGAKTRAVQLLSQTWYPRKPYFAYYQTRQLLVLGQPDDALLMSSSYQDILPGNDRVAVFLAALMLKGNKLRLLREVETLLDNKKSRTAAAEICSLLVVNHPDADVFSLLFQHSIETPFDRNEDGDRAYLSIFCAAGTMRDAEALEKIQTILKERSGGSLLSLSAAQEFFTDSHSLLRLDSFLPVLPLPMDMVYALHERFPPSPPGQQRPKSP